MAIIKVISFGLQFIIISQAFSSTNFTKIVETMTSNDSNLKSYSNQIQKDQRKKQLSYLNYLPNLYLNGFKDFNETIESKYYSINSNLNVFNGGRDILNNKISSTNLKYSQVNYQNQLLISQEKMSSILFKYINYSNIVEIYKKLLLIEKKSYKSASALYKNGQISKEKLLQADIDLQQTQNNYDSQIIQLQTAEEDVKNYLKIETKIKLQWPWKVNSISKKTFNLSYSENLPQIKTHFLTLKSYKQAKLSQYSNFLPIASLNYSKTTDFNKTSFYNDMSLSLNLSWNLFDKRKDSSEIYFQKLEILNQKNYLNEQINKTKTALRSLKRKIKLNISTVKNSNKTMKLTQQLYNKNYKRFLQGHISTNDFKMDKTRLLESLLNLNQSRYALHLSIIKICREIGKTLADCL